MSFYPSAINERFLRPRCAGDLPASNATGINASFVCGAFAKVDLTIDAGSKSISEAKFQTNGCGYMIAAADVLCSWLANKPLGALHGLAESELRETICRELGSLPEERRQCATVVFDALRTAMAEYRQDRIVEFRGESALICTCFGVSEETIVEAIATHDLNDLDDVSDVCRAGSGCGSCRMLIQELIDANKL